MSIEAGRLIVLEGPDGGGKTTQAARLVEWLRGRGREVVPCRDPGGTPLGDKLRSMLLDRSEVPIGMRAEMLLYMASRSELVDRVIGPAMSRGAVVVGDRYLLSNVVYQGVAGGLPVDDVWQVGGAATGGLMPDLTIVLDVPFEVATGRIGPSRDRIEDRGEGYRRKVRDGFLDAAARYPAPIVVVDGSRTPDEVASQIQTEVSHALAVAERP